MNFKIENDIPLPKPHFNGKHGLQECLLSMIPAQSVFVDGWKLASLRAFTSKLGSHNSKKFICRNEGEGVRIWRSE